MDVVKSLNTSEELALLGVSVFVVGFSVGPLLWAPLSEIYGRRPLFLMNAIALTAFTAGAAAAPNIQSLIILRFLAGRFGSAPMAISGGVIADTFPAVKRGLAAGLYGAAPFMGPALGPVIGGYLAQGAGWRSVEWLLAAFSGAILLTMYLFLPETYAPALLRKRARALSQMTGHVYRSKVDMEHGTLSLSKKLSVTLSRPWLLLFRERIVLLLSLYLAIIYDTPYTLFAAYPIVFQWMGRRYRRPNTSWSHDWNIACYRVHDSHVSTVQEKFSAVNGSSTTGGSFTGWLLRGHHSSCGSFLVCMDRFPIYSLAGSCHRGSSVWLWDVDGIPCCSQLPR